MHLLPILWGVSLCLLQTAHASVTVYSQIPFGQTTATATAAAANYTGAAAYNPKVLVAPPIPDPAPNNAFNIDLAATNATAYGLSMGIPGTFFGYSIEMSVANQVLGYNSTLVQVPFLNLMANIIKRAGGVHIRVGGNTQETAVWVESIPGGKILMKNNDDTSNPTHTPALLFSNELLYLMNNISSLIDVKWYLGIPMNGTSHLRLEIAEHGEAILGDNLLGFQVGNEPDLYGRHEMGGRPADYSPEDYFNEFQVVMNAYNSDTSIPMKKNIIGPSVSASQWSPELVFNTGYLDAFASNLNLITVEKYPDDNCLAIYGTAGQAKDPQTELALYVTHNAGVKLVSIFLNASAYCQEHNIPFVMFETNTASCGGFVGISDSFASAMWGLDYGLQMAYSNFSEALVHIGGQNVFYNPFTPPPTNQSAFHQWTIGPIYFSTLIVAEALGPSGTAQVLDLGANDQNEFTPAYVIYENGQPARVALFNYVTDPSGGSDYVASISVQGNGSPQSVKVKYLSADSITQKQNITWAGQNFGGNFESDGRLQGDLNVTTITCNNNICPVPVPAPGFALVFLTDSAYQESTPTDVQTFSTTAITRTKNTATINASLLATSNGHSGAERAQNKGSTSLEEPKSGAAGLIVPSTFAMIAISTGVIFLSRHLAHMVR